MGTVDYSGRLPHVDPSTVPYTFHIVMGHILDSHAFDEGKKYGKSMFCQDLSDEESLRKLIIFAFVDEFGDPNSSGPQRRRCRDRLFRIFRVTVQIPIWLGVVRQWSCRPLSCICGTCMMGERYTFARHGQRKLLSFGMFPFPN